MSSCEQPGCLIVEQKKDFDLEKVKEHFSQTLTEKGEVTEIVDVSRDDRDSHDEDDTRSLLSRELHIRPYLEAFHELTRFFRLTGPIFTFVAKDLSNKINFIENHIESENGARYQILNEMMEYEINNDTATQRRYGTRTFLRLHWALEFIIEFMNRLINVTPEVKTSQLVSEVYNQTLAAHHPWLTRRLAAIAVYTLPSLRNLIDIMCKHEFDEVQTLLTDIVQITKPILQYTTDLYARHHLEHIP